jgi:hypothetical protein
MSVAIHVAHAGTLTPPGVPTDTMYTLTDLFNLAAGTNGTLGTGILPATPGSVSPTFQSLTSIYTALSTQLSNLSAAKIASGTTAFGITGTLLGDTTTANVLTTALHPGTYNTTNLTVGNVVSGISYGISQTGTLAFGAALTGLPRTDESGCWNTAGTAISCNGTGQDGELLKGIPRTYTDNGDGTVTDNTTGLIWQKCSNGLSGSSCATGANVPDTWASALTDCNNNTAGLPGSGWYLPNIYQLTSLDDFGRSTNPYINTTYFPATATGAWWSSTTSPTSTNATLTFNFGAASMANTPKSSFPDFTIESFRCVRG